jgi:putative glutamine amidotransferase
LARQSNPVRPLVGIPARLWRADKLTLDAGMAECARGIDEAGGLPIWIPLGLSDDALRAMFDRLDGLFIHGGICDVHPGLYGQAVLPACGITDPATDRIDFDLTRWALEKRVPILGICRGIQVLNVAAGGTLYQDIPSQFDTQLIHQYIHDKPLNHLAHLIEIAPASQLALVVGTNQIWVNSFHHQAVKQVAPRFHVTARASDGIIEGIEADDETQFALGVQFHPEWLLDDDARMLRIFKQFIQAIEGK